MSKLIMIKVTFNVDLKFMSIFINHFYSDIDLVVVGRWSDPPLYTLYEELLKSDIPKPDEIVVLDKAAVRELEL